MHPPGDLEWQVRRFLGSLSYRQIARILAYVPLLVTPPAAGVALLTIRALVDRTWPLNEYDRKTVYISVVNIALSLAILLSIGSAYFEFAKHIVDEWLSVLRSAAPATAGQPLEI